ncbi:hypothetical protein [Methylovirgula sp. HY1]|uniref:hypothetical protein n=1 Tax=Methylovirgula sp. HY1 TaxID=2822761 RepID=UPI001C5A88DC|nr:hypothetical protein [Methylovirgula sp. HY1]
MGLIAHPVCAGRSTGLLSLPIDITLVSIGAPAKARFGSANATQAAFGGAFNAELVAEAETSTEANAEILGYVARIANTVESASGGSIQAVATRPSGNLPALHLPAFDIKPVGPPPGVDAWLQRGRLVAKYRDAQHFMAIPVTLKNNLPTGDVEKQFQALGLIQQDASNVVRHRYVPQVLARKIHDGLADVAQAVELT